MDPRKPSALVAAALAAPSLTWPELYELLGQQAASRMSKSMNGRWLFLDIRLDQYYLEAAGGCADAQSAMFRDFPPQLGPTLDSRDWEHALRQQFLRAAAGVFPAWNRLRLAYELVSIGGKQTAVLQEAKREWDEGLCAQNQRQPTIRELPEPMRAATARAGRQAWAASQRASLELALAQTLLPANSADEITEQQLHVAKYSGYCFAHIYMRDGVLTQQQGPWPLAQAWLVWQCWQLKWEIAPHWSSLRMILKPGGPGADAECLIRFGSGDKPNERLLLLRADGQLLSDPLPQAATAPSALLSEELFRDLQALFAAVAQAFAEYRADGDDDLLLLTWSTKWDDMPELFSINDGYRDYPDLDDVLEELKAQLKNFSAASLSAQAPWVQLYLLWPAGTEEPESGYFTTEELPFPFQAADLLPCYAQIRAGLLPQLPPTWHTLTVAAGWGDGLVPYQASAQLTTGEQLEVEVLKSARAMVALSFLYTYGLQAASCDWQHVEFTFQRTGKLTAAFYFINSWTETGVADEPKATVEEWLPAVA